MVSDTALQDELTRLPRRQAFFTFLDGLIERLGPGKLKLAVLVVDIDRFHRINRIYGLNIGDRVLRAFAQLLDQVRRPQDRLFRIGDNRFSLVLINILNSGHALLAAQKIQRLLARPLQIDDERIRLSCTLGISLYPQNARRAETLLHDAESRLYEARDLGEPVGAAREPYFGEQSAKEWEMEVDLQSAIENQQLLLYYQPQICLRRGIPVGAEALVRWQHPERGMISPNVFIPVAEQSGEIIRITNWVLNRAMRESARWTSRWGNLSVSLNIPPNFIVQPLLEDLVASTLRLWKAEHITLILEIVERSLIKDPERCFRQLNRIRKLGAKISIDDFGTGYSSLSYFQHIPVDELKIDQSFVFDLLRKEENQHIVRLITELAHAFSMKVVAEGVEDAAALGLIREYGVDVAQGYYFARPMPARAFERWLKAFKPLRFSPV